MRSKVYLALCLALILVGGAAWVRTHEKNNPSTLAIVENLEANDREYQDFISDYLVNATTSIRAASPEQKLGTTDLIGRQLVSDYISLSTNGQATQANIDALAEKYVETVPTLISPKKANSADFRITPNNKADLEYYAQEILKLYREYASNLVDVQSQKNINNLLLSSSDSAAPKMEDIYNDTAQKLKLVPVPKALIETHIKLSNLYLENAAAMKSISQINSDPASAFAGLILLNGNINEEALLLGEIEQILNKNGI